MNPCPPDCEGCAADADLREDFRVGAALDEARRRGLPTDPEPRRALVSESLRAAEKCDRCPPHAGPDNRSRSKRGARKPRSKDHRR